MQREHPFAYLKQRADVLKCCANTKNLVVQRIQPDVLRAVCTRCGRGHRKLLCEPGTLFAETLKAMAPSALQPARMLYDAHGQIISVGEDGHRPTGLVVKR